MDSAVEFKVLSIFQVALAFLLMPNSSAIPVPRNTTEIDASEIATGKQLLLVNSTIARFRDGMAAIVNTGSLDMNLCEYAGPVPLMEDITASAVSWGCYAVEKGVPTIPLAVYLMQDSNTDLWGHLRANCGCEYIFYSVPYLRYEESTRTWVYSTRKVPVGTSCSEYESPLCSNIFKSP